LHPAANVDDRESLVQILEGLQEIGCSHRIIFPAHPRTLRRIREHGVRTYFSDQSQFTGIQIVEPQGYLDFLCLMKHARLVITDSGGIQEETTALGVPCVTVRDNTERPVTLELGTNILAGTKQETIRHAIQKQLTFKGAERIPEMWDGRAGSRIVGILAERIMPRAPVPALATEAGQIQENAR